MGARGGKQEVGRGRELGARWGKRWQARGEKGNEN